MTDGATLIAPETVWFAHDTVLGRDVVVEPNVVFGPGVSVADGATIHAFSHLEGADRSGRKASVGPLRASPARVRFSNATPRSAISSKSRRRGWAKGAKASHLTYLGDADVGAGANIGAGTITCNYDGYFKYRTTIGVGAFIGSNTALVAPVTIGDGAIVGAGAVVTEDVEARCACARARAASGEVRVGRKAVPRKDADARKKRLHMISSV